MYDGIFFGGLRTPCVLLHRVQLENCTDERKYLFSDFDLAHSSKRTFAVHKMNVQLSQCNVEGHERSDMQKIVKSVLHALKAPLAGLVSFSPVQFVTVSMLLKFSNVLDFSLRYKNATKLFLLILLLSGAVGWGC